MNWLRCWTICLLAAAAPVASAQDAPVQIRFLRTDKAQAPLPPLVHLGVELSNPAKEPRWILLSLSREIRFPRDGKFAADPEGGLPFFVLQAADGDRRAVMLGFLGNDRFSAFLLPPESKVMFDDFEFPCVEDLTELDWMEAKSLAIDGKTPIEKWLPIPLDSTAGSKFGKDIAWTDALRDASTGEPRLDLPKDKVSTVVADVVRAGRLIVEGYRSPPRYYQAVDVREQPSAPDDWQLIAAFEPVRPRKVESLTFAPDGSWLAASLQTFKVVGLELGKNRERVFPLGEKNMARFFAFSPEGNLLVKQVSEPSEEDGNLDLADWSAGKVLDVLRFSSRVTLGNIDHVPSPDGQRVAIAQRTSFNLWDFNKLETINRFVWPESVAGFGYRVGAFSPDGRRFAAGLENPVAGGRAVVWDVATGKVIAEFENKQGGIHFLSFSANGDFLAGASKQSPGALLWDVDQSLLRGSTRDAKFNNMHAIAMAPDGRSLAVAATTFGNTDPTRPIELYDVPRGNKIGEFPGLRQPINALAFSRDGRRLAAGDHLGNIRVWQRK